MHRCLQIHEMIDVIVSHLSRSALAVMARTCNMFHDPALDLLWREQHGLDNVLRCMPSGLFVVEDDALERQLQRPIMSTDWDRALRYTHRVKEFHSPWFDHAPVSDILPVLSMCLPDHSLFPNLRRLQWSHADNSHFHHIDLFLNPRLAHIIILCKTPLPQLSILSTLPRKCPSLKSVSLHLPPRDLHTVVSFQSNLSVFVRRLHHLEFLHMPLPDAAALQHVAGIPTLHSLELRVLLIAFLVSPLETSFIKLRNLVLHDVDVEAASKFLQICVSAPLVSVAINNTARATLGALDHFIATLTQCSGSYSTLTSLSLDLSLHEDSSMRAHSLSTLFCFKKLTHVDIQSETGFDLDNVLIFDLARAWTHLKSLQLRESVPHIPRGLTIECLRSLSGNCPDLRFLHLSFDASTTQAPQHGQNQVSQTTLEYLDVAHSHIAMPTCVARFISAIFPNLRRISTAREYHDLIYHTEDEEDLDENAEEILFHQRWKEVQSRLDDIREERGVVCNRSHDAGHEEDVIN
ncbi:hypothetical protein GGX14DRAFT_373237 [Mycena pura]|uniref:F-box domain-containing protein n=1 Tax=Mycena pura TaxID=153505 RepID=A0AAD6Y8C5_9AGAR|nr:hypothetical protein GGX14DRAFT_373237 [Mycena pura]